MILQLLKSALILTICLVSSLISLCDCDFTPQVDYIGPDLKNFAVFLDDILDQMTIIRLAPKQLTKK